MLYGTVIAQGITLLVTPFLARIYTPIAFGEFSFFMSIVSIIGVVATLRYEMAIVLQEKKENSVNTAFLSLFINIGITVLLSMVVLLYHFFINKLPFIYFTLPLFVFLIGFGNIAQHWLNREEKYKYLSISKVVNSLSNNISALLLGLLGFINYGLITGNLIGLSIFCIFFILIILNKYKEDFKSFHVDEIKKILRKYKDLPFANSPQVLLEVFQINGIIYMFKLFFNLTVIGYYSLTLRILQAPLWFIGSSLSQILYRDISGKINSKADFYPYLLKTTSYIAFFFVPFPIILILFGPEIFSLVFGEEWRSSGVYASYMSVWMYFDFIRYTIGQVPIMLNKTRRMLSFTLLGNIILIVFTFIGGYILKDVHTTLLLTSFFMSIYALGIILWILKIAKKGN